MERYRDHYRFHLQWLDDQGRDWCEVINMPVGQNDQPDPSRLRDARRSHMRATEGGWVKRGMSDPHVSALKLVKGGRILPEDLAVKADWCGEHGRFRCHCEQKATA
jgi:hypothetical protein